MLKIDELIRQAEIAKKKFRKPVIWRETSTRTWQEMLDNKPYPQSARR